MMQIILLWLPIVILSIAVNVVVIRLKIDGRYLKDYILLIIAFTLASFAFTLLWSINSIMYITYTGQVSSVLSAIAMGQLAPAIIVLSKKSLFKD